MDNLTQATKDALNCLKNLVNPYFDWKNSPETFWQSVVAGPYKGRYWEEKSGYRPPAYQAHFVDILAKWKELQKYGKECAALKKAVEKEKRTHELGGVASSNSDHTRGEAFDLKIYGVKDSTITSYATQCGLKRVFENGEQTHFSLK